MPERPLEPEALAGVGGRNRAELGRAPIGQIALAVDGRKIAGLDRRYADDVGYLIAPALMMAAGLRIFAIWP